MFFSLIEKMSFVTPDLKQEQAGLPGALGRAGRGGVWRGACPAPSQLSVSSSETAQRARQLPGEKFLKKEPPYTCVARQCAGACARELTHTGKPRAEAEHQGLAAPDVLLLLFFPFVKNFSTEMSD